MEAIAGVDDLALVLLASLAAFGVSVTAVGGIDTVGPWIVDKFESFVDSIGASFSNVVDSMRYGVDKAGNLIGSPSSLNYSARFALSLQSEYDLSDNDYFSTASPSGLILNFDNGGSVFCPQLPVSSPSAGSWGNVTFSSNGVCYAALLNAGSTYYMYIYSLSNNTVVVSYTRPVGSSSFVTNQSSGSPGLYFGQSPISFNSLPTFLPDVPVFSFSLGRDHISSYSVSSSSNTSVEINTGVLDIPQVGDYSDDDGILIDGFGSWGDTLQDILDIVSGLTLPDTTWPTVSWGAEAAQDLVDSLVSSGELTTENSPGFYNGLPLVGGIPDIQFGNLWHYVTDWVDSMSGGLALIGGIMFSLPFVAAFYALVVILLVLSLWRLLRSA